MKFKNVIQIIQKTFDHLKFSYLNQSFHLPPHVIYIQKIEYRLPDKIIKKALPVIASSQKECI